MAHFKRDYLELFLGVIRKYMQVRGPMSQKELAELMEVGESTISRFLNQRTRELDSQLIAKMVAKLNIPLHEVIDFVDENYNDRFVKLVKYFKEEGGQWDGPPEGEDGETEEMGIKEEAGGGEEGAGDVLREEGKSLNQAFDDLKDMNNEKDKDKDKNKDQEKTRPSRAMPPPFSDFAKGGQRETPMPIKDKLERLSPRQKAYLSDFLNLDFEGRDLVVDVGTSLFRYFKQKGMEF